MISRVKDNDHESYLPFDIRKIKGHYRSGKDHLGNDFFTPCMLECRQYLRAAGYFSSHVIISWARALPRLAAKDEIKIKLIISPNLSEEDKITLVNLTSDNERKRLCERIADEIIEEALALSAYPRNDRLRLELFAWLVAKEKLEIKFAFPKHVDNPAIFHEKIGVFAFPDGSEIAFIGSANETSGGYIRNYESIDVYRSWVESEIERVNDKKDQFNEAWRNEALGLDVLGLSSKVLAKVRSLAPENNPMPDSDLGSDGRTSEDAPVYDYRWRHQEEAVGEFLKAKHGILEMATGTGKTRTALKIFTELIQSGDVNSAIVTTEGTDLLNQWANELEEWFLQRKFMSVYKHFGEFHEMGLYANHPADSVVVVSQGQLHKLLSNMNKDDCSKVLIIHDEVHKLGSIGNVQNLKGEHEKFIYRLGLSATPEREYDEKGTDFITNSIGPVFFRFGLEDAIRRGILCEFDYVPLEYELTESDGERISDVYKLRSARQHNGDPMTKEEFWTRIAAVYKTAEQKPAVFSTYVKNSPEAVMSAIIFVHTKEYGERIVDIVHKYTPRFSTYFDDDPKSQLEEFSVGNLDCLITCHRLSQGIDVRHLKRVVLFSSDRAKLETIQRMGRCLRIDENDPHKRATVIDFVRDTNGSDEENSDQIRKKWLTDLSNLKREE